MGERKALVIGLDAACAEQLDPLLADGVVPNLEKLMDDGVTAPLETTTPPWTPSAWTSLVTGTSPWSHGVYDFYHYGDGEPRLVSARDVRRPFVWEILSAAGFSSIVVNVPVTHPIHEFDGGLVPGYLAPADTDCLVDGAPRTLAEFDDEYSVYERETSTREDRLAEYERLVDSRTRAVERLDEVHDWSFAMVQFQSTDAVFHTDGHDRDAVARVYARVDDAVGSLLELAGDDCPVFVVSDHGIHQYSRVFYCNSWLRDRNYLETSDDAERYVWNDQAKRSARDGEEASDRRPVVRAFDGIITGLRQLGITPRHAERTFAFLGLDEAVGRWLPQEALHGLVDASEHVDRSQSAAYCRSLSSFGIRCNVRGRDDGGVVPVGEFDSFRSALVDELRSVRDSTGAPVFESVYDRHEVHGSTVANERSAPDIVVRPTNMEWKISDIVRERVFGNTTEFSHTFTGIWVASGPGVGSFPVDELSVVDVVPTLLGTVFGIDPPGYLDGEARLPSADDRVEATASPRVPPRGFFEGHERAQPGEAVIDQLEAMGYVDRT